MELSEPAVEGTLHSADGVGIVRMRTHCGADVDDVWSALTDPLRLARWFGKVNGDLQEDGEATALVMSSGWDGRVHIDKCVPRRELRVTMWEEEGSRHSVSAELLPDGAKTDLAIEVRGVPLDVLWAYGAGWQEHVEDLRAHLEGKDRASTGPDARFDEIAPHYREMAVIAI